LSIGPFRGTAAIRDGLITASRLRSSCWRRTLPDVYVHAGLLDHPLMRARSVALMLPAGAAVSGRSAAWLYGVDVRDGDEVLEVTVPRGRAQRSHSSLRVCHALLPGTDVARVGGVPVTTPVRTAFDLARGRDEVGAVIGLDALLHAKLVSVAQVADSAAAHPGWRGVRRVGPRLTLAESATESPMETRLRLLLIDGGLPRPVAQVVVRDRYGEFIARLDLAYPMARLGIEYDGGGHRDPAAWRDDLRRQNRLRAVGWTLLRYTAPEVYQRAGAICRQVGSVISAAA
jgi:very-short-patch-repair endonuclease